MIDNAPFDPEERPALDAVTRHAAKSDDALFDQLQRSAASPDLTRLIMGRLGYMQVAPKVARRHRLRRWGSRMGLALVAAVAVGIGMRTFEGSDRFRRPAGPTIPAALQNDLQRQQDRLGGMIRVIRDFQPRLDPKPLSEPKDVPPRPLNEDVNRAASSKVRWV
jgi:hypothetical protein